MDKDFIRQVVTALITGVGTIAGAFWTFRGKHEEVQSGTEKIYIDGNQLLFDNMQKEITRLTQDVAILKNDMKEMKEDYEAKIERLEKENDDLRNKLRDSIAEVKYLKEKLKQ